MMTTEHFRHINTPTVLCVAKGPLGNTFNVVLIPAGDTSRSAKYPTKQVTVEFYDTRYSHTGYGQFVSGYWLSTFLPDWPSGGLDLMGNVPAWKVSAEGMAAIWCALEALAHDFA
jgi:hypothetical protein